MVYPLGKRVWIALCIVTLAVTACNNNDQPAVETSSAKNNADTLLPLPVADRNNHIALLDKSPMDVVYFPEEYPKLKMMGTLNAPPLFRVFYSRPQRNGRSIFGSVIRYGEPWRLGANEATEIEFFSDVRIQDVKVPKGRYIMYCIPQPEEWTIVFNSDLYSWGLKFNKEKDIFKFTLPVIHENASIEAFTIESQTAKDGANLWIGWDHSKVALPVSINR
ncbi:MAG: DUF2911 domain-containing protein [Chitinophagaceae bacterium]|nr:DUF2911 domain-containing protein [Chitinophagaceae bacterium]